MKQFARRAGMAAYYPADHADSGDPGNKGGKGGVMIIHKRYAL
jgi:hypothetical protein